MVHRLEALTDVPGLFLQFAVDREVQLVGSHIELTQIPFRQLLLKEFVSWVRQSR